MRPPISFPKIRRKIVLWAIPACLFLIGLGKRLFL